jgi:uncharacterized protein
MNKYGTEFSKRVSDILALHTGYTDPIEETKKILYEMLEPTPDRGDMLYRYEHCIRTAENARRIALAEGLPVEQLVMAGILHDIGYKESESMGGFKVHQFVSADIASVYLDNINYDIDHREEIVTAIARHNLTDELPDDMTVFQMTVRDSDDIDRFDIIRTSMVLGDCVYEKTNCEIIEACNEAIKKAEWLKSLKRGTKTAREMFDRVCEKRIGLLKEILDQANKDLIAIR